MAEGWVMVNVQVGVSKLNPDMYHHCYLVFFHMLIDPGNISFFKIYN